MKNFIDNLKTFLSNFQTMTKVLCIAAGIAAIAGSWTAVAICLGILTYDILKSVIYTAKSLEAQDKAIKDSLDDIKDIKSTLTIVRNKLGFNKL